MAFGQLEIRIPDGTVKTFDLIQPQTRLGRSPEVDIPVNDPQISRIHVLFQAAPEGVSVIDQGSANGTFINNMRLVVNEPFHLVEGTAIRVGQTVITFHAIAVAESVESPTQGRAPVNEDREGDLTKPEIKKTDEKPRQENPPISVEKDGVLPEPEINEITKEKVEKKPRPASDFDKPPEIPPRQLSSENGGRIIRRLDLQESTYIKYLPDMYGKDDFAGRFLLIFETVLSPIEQMIDQAHHYLDPQLTPPEFLPWLASWLGLVLNENWPDAKRRQLIMAAAELYQWRGTRKGLVEFIKLYTGANPEIEEPGVGMKKINPEQAYKIVIKVKNPAGNKIDLTMLKTIVEAEKPAHVSYLLKIEN